MVESVHVEREYEQGQEREKENKQKLKDAVALKGAHCRVSCPQDSPVNKLLYAREIPRYKQLVER